MNMDANVVTLIHDNGSSAKIHLFGATVISWINDNTEQLFLSTLSKMDGSKAIRGGIPVVFPNFGPWSCGPQHGFARISWWKLQKQEKLEDCVRATFVLEENDHTLSLWKYRFRLTYTVELRPQELETSLSISNTGTESFDFTALLHTYFRVSSIKECSVTGFEGCTYNDKVTKEDGRVENREKIHVDANVDSVYISSGTKCHFVSSQGRKIKIEKQNLKDTVLWNPWSAKAKEMSDFDDEGYLNMICVEAGHVSERKVLQPGEIFGCGQKLKIVN
ncbi:uncharacterized protein LOC120342985 isoform X1 [Styela clava]